MGTRLLFAKEWVAEEPFRGRCFQLKVPRKLITCSTACDEEGQEKVGKKGVLMVCSREPQRTRRGRRDLRGQHLGAVGSDQWGGDNKDASSLKPSLPDPATAEPGMQTQRPRDWAHLAWLTCASAHTPHWSSSASRVETAFSSSHVSLLTPTEPISCLVMSQNCTEPTPDKPEGPERSPRPSC